MHPRWNPGGGAWRGAILAAALLAGCPPAEQQPAPPNAPPGGNQPQPPPPAGAETREIRMTAREFRYEPAQITAQPGQPVRVILVNRGNAPHNLEFELPQGEAELPEDLRPGSSGTLEFTAPAQPGRYRFYCPVGNHEERGMVGTLIVQPGGSDTQGGP